MGQVLPDRLADDGGLGLPPPDAGDEAVLLEAQEGADRTADVVALRPGGAHLGALDAAVLLEATVVDLDAPGPLGVLAPGQLAHREVAGRPVFPVTVWGDDQEDQDEAVALQMDARPPLGDDALAERAIARAIRVHGAVRLQLGHPAPTMAANGLAIGQ